MPVVLPFLPTWKLFDRISSLGWVVLLHGNPVKDGHVEMGLGMSELTAGRLPGRLQERRLYLLPLSATTLTVKCHLENRLPVVSV